MALEDLTGSSKFISALNPAWPVDDDWVDEGDNHLRGIKNVLKNTFPALDGPVTLTDEQMNGVLVAAPESRIINGNFAIDQRSAGAAVAITGGTSKYTVDRWYATVGAAGPAFSVKQEHAGGVYFLVSTVTTTGGVDPNNYALLVQGVEGYQVGDFELGLNAKEFIFACRMSSTVAGTFPISFRNGTVTRSCVMTVTVPANVWTTVMVKVPGVVGGAWDYGNGTGLQVSVGLGVGANWNAPSAGVWHNGHYLSVAGCTNLMATANAQFSLTDVRLYPGSIDYGPCQRLYADELRLCQRYYCKTFSQGVVPAAPSSDGQNGAISTVVGPAGMPSVADWQFPVAMRATPVITFYDPFVAGGTWRNRANTHSATANAIAANSASATIEAGGGVQVLTQYFLHVAANAEL